MGARPLVRPVAVAALAAALVGLPTAVALATPAPPPAGRASQPQATTAAAGPGAAAAALPRMNPPRRLPRLWAASPVPRARLVPVRRIDLGASVGARGWAGEDATSSRVSGGVRQGYADPVTVGAAGVPEAVYRDAHEGNATVLLQGLRPGAAYTLRLHLVENYWTDAGQRVMDVLVNGRPAAQGVDPARLAGGPRRAATTDLAVTASSTGTVSVALVARVDLPSVAGLELLRAQPPGARTLFPEGRPTRVMAVGDSITWGSRAEGSGGFRYPLWDTLTALGHDVEPVGPMTEPASSPGSRWYGSGYLGWGGWRIEELLGPTELNRTGETIDSWVPRFAPDIVLLHIGNNDNEQNESQTRMRQELDTLLTRLHAARPEAHVLVARIVNQGTANPAISRYNETLSDLVVDRQLRGERLHLVDMESVVRANDFADGIHPTPDGYRRMAQAWATALQ